MAKRRMRDDGQEHGNRRGHREGRVQDQRGRADGRGMGREYHDSDDPDEGMGDARAGAVAGARLINDRRYYGAGQGDFANMPREVKMEMYPRTPYGVGIDYADNYDRIDHIERSSDKNMHSQVSREMY